MALRAGVQTGPEKLVDDVGIAAAILAPLALLLYIVIADDRPHLSPT